MTSDTIDRRAALETLYAVFARYPLRWDMPHCPCCVKPEEVRALHGKSLRMLTQELRRYSATAMSTWGDVVDYKHFLPRLLELAAQEPHEVFIDATAICTALRDGDFAAWPAAERDAVVKFCQAWWDAAPAHVVTDWAVELGDFVPYEIVRRLEEFAAAGSASDWVTLCELAGHGFQGTARLPAMTAWIDAPERDLWLHAVAADTSDPDVAGYAEFALETRAERSGRRTE